MNVRGNVLPLDRANVDTDQIIPAHYLTGIETTGLGKHLFTGMTGGAELLAAHPDASIVVARENFGCGSSREHAAWSLADRGFRAVVAPSFARIFFENAYNNGIAPIVVAEPQIARLLEAAFLDIDLETETLTLPDGSTIGFLARKRSAVREWLERRGSGVGPAPKEPRFSTPM